MYTDNKTLLNLTFITDSDNLSKLGELDGYFDPVVLREYIEVYGSKELIVHLGKLIAQVCEKQVAVNYHNNYRMDDTCCNCDIVDMKNENKKCRCIDCTCTCIDCDCNCQK